MEVSPMMTLKCEIDIAREKTDDRKARLASTRKFARKFLRAVIRLIREDCADIDPQLLRQISLKADAVFIEIENGTVDKICWTISLRDEKDRMLVTKGVINGKDHCPV